MLAVDVSTGGEMAVAIRSLAGRDAEIRFGSFRVVFRTVSESDQHAEHPKKVWDPKTARAVVAPRARIVTFEVERDLAAKEWERMPPEFLPKT